MSVVRNIGQVFSGTANIDFEAKWKKSLAVSLALVLVSVILVSTRGLNLSIDFEGGTIWRVPAESSLSVADVRAAAPELDTARIQEVGGSGGSVDEFNVQVSTDVTNLGEIREALAEVAGIDGDLIGQDSIGPTWGNEITNSAIRALVFFGIVVAGYLAWTLEAKMALAALSAVVHDLIITAGVYSLTGLEVSPSTVIALLTILGYSLYDTVVVFDKIKENESSPLVSFDEYGKLVSHSMNQVVARSINTTITTVLPVASMLVVGSLVLRATSLAGFSLALFIGLILGTYSSIFFASPILVWLRKVLPSEKAQDEVERKRAERRKATKKSSSQGGVGMIAPKGRKTKGR